MKKSIVIGIVGTIIGYLFGEKKYKKDAISRITELEAYGDKYFSLFDLTCEWLKKKQQGQTVLPYFEENNMKRVAIYGMGNIGEILFYDLKEIGISVEYAIDRRKDLSIDGLNIVSIDEELGNVDAIIVTAVFEYDAIYDTLKNKVTCPVINLEDIIYEI